MQEIQSKIMQEIAKANLENRQLTIVRLAEDFGIAEIDVQIFLAGIVEEIDSQNIYDYIQALLPNQQQLRQSTGSRKFIK